jgi:metal-responsive CopG/Arc/MetJ family transcriptional regulator
MSGKTAVLRFSVNPELANEYERIAEREGTTKSELFRRMIASYKAEREEEEFLKLQRKMARAMSQINDYGACARCPVWTSYQGRPAVGFACYASRRSRMIR